jgi:hypothetical protein
VIASATIDISSAPDPRLTFSVVNVDFELRLYQDGVEVLGVRKGQPPTTHPLSKLSSYIVRYNNNDGGAGLLHFKVVEGEAQPVVRYEVNIATISSPEVLNLQFSLRPNLRP